MAVEFDGLKPSETPVVSLANITDDTIILIEQPNGTVDHTTWGELKGTINISDVVGIPTPPNNDDGKVYVLQYVDNSNSYVFVEQGTAPTTTNLPGLTDVPAYPNANTGQDFILSYDDDSNTNIWVDRADLDGDKNLHEILDIPNYPNNDDGKEYKLSYDDNTNTFIWKEDTTIDEASDVQNGIVFLNGKIELGMNPIIKPTVIGDPTDNHDIIITRGLIHMGLQTIDQNGIKSANLTGVALNNDNAIVKATEFGTFEMMAESSDKTAFSEIKGSEATTTYIRKDPSGNVTGIYQAGTAIEVKSSKSTSGMTMTAGVLVTDSENAELRATDGAALATRFGVSKDKLRVVTKNVNDGTADNGQYLKLIDKVNGEVEFADTVNSGQQSVSNSEISSLSLDIALIDFEDNVPIIFQATNADGLDFTLSNGTMKVYVDGELISATGLHNAPKGAQGYIYKEGNNYVVSYRSLSSSSSNAWVDITGRPNLAQIGGNVSGSINLSAGTFTLNGPAAGSADGVLIAGIYNPNTKKIDFSAAAPASGFSVDLAQIKLPTLQEFDSNEDAIAGGLSVGDTYKLSNSNEYGLPQGLHIDVN